MGLIKCPRCELNYMLDTDKMCSVCKREVRGESEQYEMIELCSECGENPVVPGQELCAYCLKELTQREADTQNEETVVADASNIGDIDSVSTMDEIIPEIDEDIPSQEYGEIENELSLESVREEEDEDDEDEDEDDR